MFLLNQEHYNLSVLDGLLFSLIAIVIVFVILVFIIAVVSLLAKIDFSKFDKKKATPAKKPAVASAQKKLTMEDIKDDDMMVAALIATAEFVEETKEKDARLVSIKQIG